MADSTWPLRNKHLPESFAFFTKGEVGEMLSEFDDDTAIWLANYWQPENDGETLEQEQLLIGRPMALLASSVGTVSDNVVALRPL